MAMCFREQCQPTGRSLSGYCWVRSCQQRHSRLSRRAGQPGSASVGHSSSLVPAGPFRCDRPTDTGRNHSTGGFRGTAPRCWANRGWDGAQPEVWTLPILELPQSFLQDAAAQRTPGEGTPGLHTHLGAPTSPLLCHNCSFWCAKPKLPQGSAGREPRPRRSAKSPPRIARRYRGNAASPRKIRKSKYRRPSPRRN